MFFRSTRAEISLHGREIAKKVHDSDFHILSVQLEIPVNEIFQQEGFSTLSEPYLLCQGHNYFCAIANALSTVFHVDGLISRNIS